MWAVENSVEEVENSNVDLICPQNFFSYGQNDEQVFHRLYLVITNN